MAEETTKIQVGEGTQAQLIIGIVPLQSLDPSVTYDLDDLDWEVTFIGKGEYTIVKEEATSLNDGTYECLVDTGATGKASELMAVLKVKNIPTTSGGTRIEVTPKLPTGIEVI